MNQALDSSTLFQGYSAAEAQCGGAIPAMVQAAQKDKCSSAELITYLEQAGAGMRLGQQTLTHSLPHNEHGQLDLDSIVSTRTIFQKVSGKRPDVISSVTDQIDGLLKMDVPPEQRENLHKRLYRTALDVGEGKYQFYALGEQHRFFADAAGAQGDIVDPTTLLHWLTHAKKQIETILRAAPHENGMPLVQRIRQTRTMVKGLIFGHQPLQVIADRLPSKERRELLQLAEKRLAPKQSGVVQFFQKKLTELFQPEDKPHQALMEKLAQRMGQHWNALCREILIASAMQKRSAPSKTLIPATETTPEPEATDPAAVDVAETPEPHPLIDGESSDILKPITKPPIISAEPEKEEIIFEEVPPETPAQPEEDAPLQQFLKGLKADE